MNSLKQWIYSHHYVIFDIKSRAYLCSNGIVCDLPKAQLLGVIHKMDVFHLLYRELIKTRLYFNHDVIKEST